MTTSIAKTKTGWQGNTRILIGDNRVLLIQTAKASDGSLVTTGSVRKVTRNSDSVTEVWTRHDYNRLWLRWSVRVTEKQVRAQHSQALDMVDVMVFDIDKHYAVDKV
jgi:hypothetical protein